MGGPNKSSRGRHMQYILGIVIFVVVLFAGVVTWFIVSGMLTLTWAGTNKVQVASTRIVCDDETVTQYNKVAMYQLQEGATAPTLDSEGLKKLTDEIKNRNGYQDDPTCHNILFWQAIFNNNYTEASNSLVVLKSLHDKHLYPDNNLYNVQGLSEYNKALQSINPEKTQAVPGQNEGE